MVVGPSDVWENWLRMILERERTECYRLSESSSEDTAAATAESGHHWVL